MRLPAPLPALCLYTFFGAAGLARQIRVLLVALPVAFLMLAAVGGSNPLVPRVAEAQSPACGISQPAFCDTFDQPAGTGNRSGQLNGTLWGVSRASGIVNMGQAEFNAWLPTQLQACGGSTTVQPPNDVIVCNGQVREAVDDLTSVTTLAMYPKQPFDFAGRTGIVAFDVSNDTQGTHTVWPEFWITDQPVPTPFTHFASWLAAPRNGFGIRLGAMTVPGQGHNIAPACPNDANSRWSADSVVVSRNYALDDQDNGGSAHLTMLDCVIASTGPGDMNHVEVHVAQNQIDVYATDAGTLAPLHHIAVVQNANLSFTRGLIWIEDVHYNADKFGMHNQRQHTFAWDNVGFDGPLIARDLTFDALDSLSPIPLHPAELSLGWGEGPHGAIPLLIPGVSDIQNAAAALLTFNFFQPGQAPSTLDYVVNGQSHSVAWPYPDQTSGTWRTLAVPVPLSELSPATDIVSISSDQTMVISNVDLILVAAGGGGCVCPSAPATPATFTPTPTPSPTGSPPSVATVTRTPTRTPVSGSGATSELATPSTSAADVATATPGPDTADPPPGNFVTSVRLSQLSLSSGSTETITLSVTSQVAASAGIDIEILDPSGHQVAQKWLDNQAFAAGQTQTASLSWAIPSTAARTTYNVAVGVLSPGGRRAYVWRDHGLQFSVR